MSTSSKRPLKVGLFLSVAEGSAGAHWSSLKGMAQHAEAAGFNSLWLGDHMVIPRSGVGGPDLGRWDCWSLLASLAAVTSRIELGPLVACTSFRNPALLAKMADTIEEVSNGRLILGLGAGYYEPEYRAFGFPFDHRMARFEEALQIIHGLLRHGAMDFSGKYYQARECTLRPRGPRPGGPPILIGARADRPRSLRLTAQYADYWNISANTAANMDTVRDAVDATCVQFGRDPATLQRTAHALIDLPSAGTTDVLAGMQAYRASRGSVTGTTEELVEGLWAFVRAGISHVQLWLQPNTLAGIDAFLPVLEALDRG